MISVSFLKSKYDRKTTLKMIDESDADLIHVDLMDGIYVPEKNFILEDIINDLKDLSLRLDIHLMVNNPLPYIQELIKLNVYMFTVHLDGTPNIEEVIDYVTKHNVKMGIAINPDDDIAILNNYFDKIDYVLIMSVYPGKGGQKFIPDVLKNIPLLKSKHVLIGIDGGINDEVIKLIKPYKLDIIISGSFICMSDNFNEQIKKLTNWIVSFFIFLAK